MKNQPVSRRSAIQLASATGLAAATSAVEAASPKLKEGDVILFQGDSITDAGRDKKMQSSNNSRSLGRGYPSVIASRLLSKYPALGLQIHNVSAH